MPSDPSVQPPGGADPSAAEVRLRVVEALSAAARASTPSRPRRHCAGLLPLGVGGSPIGTLDLYRDRPGGLSRSELAIALWTRDAVTFAVLNLRPRRKGGEHGPGDEVAPRHRRDSGTPGHPRRHRGRGPTAPRLAAPSPVRRYQHACG
ncbi:hypothetical protein ABZ848_20300 [Streptomyces sp. NPDC047081]|uniref:hypothetical protein n=1 Tax=Streptomyces sp. NPDC047081 TaxID=3154706 RepID=UPI0033CBCFCD